MKIWIATIQYNISGRVDVVCAFQTLNEALNWLKEGRVNSAVGYDNLNRALRDLDHGHTPMTIATNCVLDDKFGSKIDCKKVIRLRDLK